PPRIRRTPTAATRVRIRNPASPARSRSSARARATDEAVSTPWLSSVTSTTDRLLAGSIHGLLPSLRKSPTKRSADRSTSGHSYPRARRWRGTKATAFDAALPIETSRYATEELLRHGVDRLAGGVLDLVAPRLLDAVDDILRHGDVVKVLGHLAA